MANINDFKARLKGGGARANQFKITLPFPGYSAVGGETATLHSYVTQHQYLNKISKYCSSKLQSKNTELSR